MNDIIRIMQAADQAARWHKSQKRKGEAAEPYMNHLLEVAALVAAARDVATVEVTPNHLVFTSEDYARLGNLLQMNPPMRDVGVRRDPCTTPPGASREGTRGRAPTAIARPS